MIEKILGKFDFANPHYNADIVFLLLLIWVGLVGCCIWSILGQRYSFPLKLFWIVLVVALPGLGLLLYLPFSMRGELFPLLGFWRDPK